MLSSDLKVKIKIYLLSLTMIDKSQQIYALECSQSAHTGDALGRVLPFANVPVLNAALPRS